MGRGDVLGPDGAARDHRRDSYDQSFLLFGLAAAAFLDAYLVTDVGGRWIERFDAAARPVARVVPASTFSHIVVAFEELLERLAQT